MIAVFKSDELLFYIDKYGDLHDKPLSGYVKNIPHIDTQKIMYYLCHKDVSYPVYYIKHNCFITKNKRGRYMIRYYAPYYKKSYTEMNLKLLDEL